MTATDVRLQFEQAVQAFEAVDVDCKIAVLWQTYDTLGQAFAAIAPVALFSQAVQQLLSQIQQVDREDQAAILRDILAGADTRFTHAYRGLNPNMKLAFWHRLFHLMPASRLPLATCQNGSTRTQTLLARLNTMGLNERLHFLRRVVG
ncbi:orange carotenoid protein N-terminal domain-containing protein [Leptolyngbya sp. KIOST-1]|uniref:orange carotenoid protein N-terminal domain-containing protein n=1 Tax=Leptolyngbya sp. KIOST-1 TaxID=1229172 RepID=UPI00056C1B49|nr:orange carotenoid protein N-terminal domain-containing protein [Leptolyngbya sp. KIOST-1]